MTRINIIPVGELTSKHLVAEYREIPRVWGLSHARLLASKSNRAVFESDIPAEYRMGKGHVKFFYNKLSWILSRQRELYLEMKRRSYQPNYSPAYPIWCSDAPYWMFQDWAPSREEIAVNRARIEERLSGW